MRSIRSTNTKPEITIRSALHRSGYRFRLHDKSLPGCPDVVLRKYSTVIQIRGCFWHGHSCPGGHVPKSRVDYWGPKLLKNKARDRRNDNLLRKGGWSLLVVWECDCKGAKLQKTVDRLIAHLERLIPN